MAEWFYTERKVCKGPISFDELKDLSRSGYLNPTDLVWTQGMANWEPASATAGLFDKPAKSRAATSDALDDPAPRRLPDRNRPDRPGDDVRPERGKKKSNVGLVLLIMTPVVVVLMISVVALIAAVNEPEPPRPAPFNGGQPRVQNPPNRPVPGKDSRTVEPIRLKEPQNRWNGNLANTDVEDVEAFGCCCKVYTYRMIAGKTYTIDLESQQFDAFLRLEDDTGFRLAIDDDGGGNLNARIIFQPTRTALYRVIARALGPHQFGDFVLKINMQDLNPDDVPMKPAMPPTMRFLRGRAIARGDLDGNDELVYQIKLVQGVRYDVTMRCAPTKGARPSVRLHDQNGNELAAGDGNGVAQYSYVCMRNGDYRLVLLTTDGTPTPFDLNVVERRN